MAVLKDRLRQLEDLVMQQRAPGSQTDAKHSAQPSLIRTANAAVGHTQWSSSSSATGSSMTPSGTDDPTDDIYDEDDDNIDPAKFLQLPVVLPPAPQAWVLLQEYLVVFNKAAPLFDQQALVNIYTDGFAAAPNIDCLHPKAVYSTMAMAYCLHAISPLAFNANNINAKSFMEQTSTVLPRILIARPSLPSAQYLCAMAVVMQRPHNSHGARSLLAAALLMLLDVSPYGVDYDEKQATRVFFWIVSSMDVDLAIQNGQWSSNVFSPPRKYERIQYSEDTGTLPIGDENFPIFRHRVELTEIQSQLLGAVASSTSLDGLSTKGIARQKLFTSLQTVASRLTTWRLAEPLFQTYPDPYRHKIHGSELVHLTVLEATYFSTLFRVQAALQHIGPFRGSVMFHLPRYQKLDFWDYLGEALRLLSPFNFLPHSDFAFVWLVLDAVVSAAYVLLNSALQKPHLSKAREDLAATASVPRLLSELVQKYPQKRLATALAELDRLYRQVLTKPA